VSEDTSKTPILPLSIISTSFPGIALMDYSKKGEEELELVEGDQLRVFKRYNHWSYVGKIQSFVIYVLTPPNRL
jgi:bZIP factor